jgi:enoyl-CoA hydratase/3-hydroxyacyl-CoA dehydrogenase
MGSAIAQHFAMKGLTVRLIDLKQDSVDRGLAGIRTSLAEAVERKVIAAPELDAMMGRLHGSTDLAALKDVQLVIEAVFEDETVKRALLTDLEKHVASDCIIGSNTSSFSISSLATSLLRPERFVGVHYFYHAAKNKLVELIAGDKSSDEVISRLGQFYDFADKLPIVVRDVPGFAVNRFFVPWLNEAARLFDEGLGSPAFIDEVAKRSFKIGMGPFALMNATGVPIAMHAAKNLAEAFGPFYAPAESLIAQVESKKPWDLTAPGRGKDDELAVHERLLASALGVAAQMVSENVADAAATDLGARVGLRWAQGPVAMINAMGVGEARSMVDRLFRKWHLPVPAMLTRTPRGASIPVNLLRSWVTGATGFIEFGQPDTMNPLSEEVFVQLERTLARLQADPKVERIALMGRGKAFVAGADIKFFVKNLEAGNLKRIEDFAASGHRVLDAIAHSKKPTLAYIDGMALGGGLELALACSHRFATERSKLAFPETGIGIIPGLGGTQRTPRRIGKGLAKFMVATGQMLSAQTSLDYGLIDQLVPRLVDRNTLATMAWTSPAERHTARPEDGFAGFNGHLDAALLATQPYATHAKSLGRKAPLAMEKAMELIDQGSEMKLEDALALELRSLGAVFSTQDARAGLEGALKREPVRFTGA